MKRTKRIFALLVALIMMLTVTACDNTKKDSREDKKTSVENNLYSSDYIINSLADKENKQENDMEVGADGGLETVPVSKQVTENPGIHSRKLVMATNAQFPPYEYYQGNSIVGIDVEIAELIAWELGMELEIKDMDFNGILGAVQNGTADIGMAGMTATAQREEYVNFTNAYAENVQVIVVMQGSDIESFDDLTGKRIGVVAETTADIYVTDDFGEDNIVRILNSSGALMELMSGTVDAIVISDTVAEGWMLNNDSIAVIGTPYSEEYYSIAVAKENVELLNQINAAIAKLEREGKIQAIVNRYEPQYN